MKKIIQLFLTVLTVSSAYSQREMNMFFLQNTTQASYINPAAVPNHKLSIGLPGISSIYTDVLAPSFTFDDLYNAETSMWEIDELVDNHLKDKNLVSLSNQIDLLSVRFKAGNNFVSFTNTLKTEQSVTYPGDLAKFGWHGNDSQETFDFSALGARTSVYTEHAIGLTYIANKNWTVGGKFKVYNGIFNMQMTSENFDITFSDDEFDNYTATVDANLKIKMAGIPTVLDVDSLVAGSNYDVDGTELTDEELETRLKNNRPIFSNAGLGIDFGVNYHLNDDIELFASIIDLGYIRWKENTSEYNIDYNFGTNGYGFELIRLLNDSNNVYSDSLSQAYTDSLANSVSYSGEAASYVTMPVFKFYLGGKYKLLDHTHINALFNLTVNQGVRAAFSLGVYQEVMRFLDIHITNTIQYGKLINLGAGLVIKPGPFQFYFVFDNIPVSYVKDESTLIPDQTNQFNARVGMNLVFGKNKDQEKLQGIVE